MYCTQHTGLPVVQEMMVVVYVHCYFHGAKVRENLKRANLIIANYHISILYGFIQFALFFCFN